MDRIKEHIPKKLKGNHYLHPLLKELEEEILTDFNFNYRKAISEFYSVAQYLPAFFVIMQLSSLYEKSLHPNHILS